MVSDLEFDEVRKLVKDLCGLSLSVEKKYLIRSRLGPVLHRHCFASFSELVRQCSAINGPALRDEVIQAMTTNETSFFRDTQPFEELKRTILPSLIQDRFQKQVSLGLPPKLRIWSAATSTGQEAYSLAMLVLEGIEKSLWDDVANRPLLSTHFSILATDISSRALEAAKLGQYQRWELERGLTVEQQSRYFVESRGTATVRPELGKLIEFRRLNLLDSFADIVGLDIILCRNVLIYFDEATRRDVAERIMRCLAPGGILMLGSAESIPCLPAGIAQETSNRVILYRKRS